MAEKTFDNPDLLIVIRALKALEKSKIDQISETQATLVTTVLMILDRLLPTQTWQTKLEFLAKCLGFKHSHNQSLMEQSGMVMRSNITFADNNAPFETILGVNQPSHILDQLSIVNEVEMDNISISNASISVYAEQYLHNHAVDWKT